MKEKKLRIEDALSATKAAVEEGIVSGGGTAYINIIPKVENIINQLSLNVKETMFYDNFNKCFRNKHSYLIR